MGAWIHYEDFPACNAAQLRQAYAEAIRRAMVEHGTDPYCGTLSTKRGHGLMIREDRLCATATAAREWLSEQHPAKDGPAIAVRYIHDDLPRDTAIEEAQKTVVELRRQLATIPQDLALRARGETSATKDCKACGSAIATAWIGRTQNRDHFGRPSVACPVCGDEEFLWKESDRSRREELNEAIKAEEARIALWRQAAEGAAVQGATPDQCRWMVVASCSC